jgi:hypothetical protein
MPEINEVLISLTTLILAGSVIAVLIIGHLNRKGGKDGETRGIGWQFIRYTVLSIALPIVAILALNNALEGEAATIIAGALGYAFGKKDDS